MPIFEQTYRSYDGQLRRRFRWLIVAEQELRILIASRVFIILFLLGMLMVLLRTMMVLSLGIAASNPNSALAVMMRTQSLFAVNSTFFLDFLRMQGPVLFLTMIMAGSGMLCDDFQNNLMEVYFSKPLSWRDYVLGKISALTAVGMALTAIPGLFLLLLHNLLVPGWKTIGETWWLPFPIIAFSCMMVLPSVVGVLASSAMFPSQRFASIAIFMVLFANIVVIAPLPMLLHDRNYAILAVPMAINSVGEALFAERTRAIDLYWGWSLLYAGVIILLCLAIVCARARRAEVAK